MGVGLGAVQGECKRRFEVFVKLQKKKVQWGGGVGLGEVRWISRGVESGRGTGWM